MLKSLLARYPLILLSCSFIGLAHAYPEFTNDPLQSYRDEIKQSETNASQAVLDALQAHTEPDPTTIQQQSQQATPKSSLTTPTSRSNADKAFTPADNTLSNSSHSSNKNPWLQPNPWAKQPPNIWEKSAKVNPYANAPIPGPTSPHVSTKAGIPSPPNIFAPPKQPTNPNNSRSNANS